MPAKIYDCLVTDIAFLTPNVLGIRFEPRKCFSFLPGQFLSVLIPPKIKKEKLIKRCYSFASGPELSKKNGYELCVKYVKDGIGSEYLAGLQKGDHFLVSAAYGDFYYKTPNRNQNVCFISTGTGIGPLRSMIYSTKFQNHLPQQSTLIFGARTENDIFYTNEIKAMGIKTICALTQPTENWTGFRGRVTDYLRTLPMSMDWQRTDFYICGNGAMVIETVNLLKLVFGVPDKAVFRETFRPVQMQLAIEPEKKVA